MMQAYNPEAGKRIVVYVDADIMELIPVFLENQQEELDALVEACGQNDYETIQVLGHNIKGCGGAIGFDAITDIASSLEQSAKEQDSEQVRKLVGDLSSYLDRLEVVCV